jgi:putrescine aminotransferase
VVRLEPPLIIGKEHVDEALAVFAEALKATEKALEGLLG